MYIAIIDDIPSDCREVELLIEYYLKDFHPTLQKQVTFCQFNSAEQFWAAFQKQNFSLIILDIFMLQMNGIELAQRIRQFDQSTPIIFLTSSEEYSLDGYLVSAAGYFLKPLSEHKDNFFKILNRLAANCFSPKTMRVLINNNFLDVPLVKIIYLECYNSKTAILHLVDLATPLVTKNSYLPLAKLLLLHNNFIECYHRITLNMDFIKSMNENTFTLQNDEQLPISRRKKDSVKRNYLAYLIERPLDS